MIVAQSEKQLDENCFNDPDAGVVNAINIDDTAEHEIADLVKETHQKV